MRSLPIELLTEYQKDFFTSKFLFVMEWSRTHRWTDCANNIYYGGNWYDSRDISFDALQLSMNPKVDQITLQIDDVDRTLTKIFLSENIQDKRCWIYEVPLDKNLSPLSTAVLLFLGYCDATARPIGAKKFSIEVYNDMIKWRRMTPRRMTSPTCPWEFKDGPNKVIGSDTQTYVCILNHVGYLTTNKPITGSGWSDFWSLTTPGGGEVWTAGDSYYVGTCRYGGPATTCDRSWTQCLGYGNTGNFGGFKYINALQDKDLWWGQPASSLLRGLLAWKRMGH